MRTLAPLLARRSGRKLRLPDMWSEAGWRARREIVDVGMHRVRLPDVGDGRGDYGWQAFTTADVSSSPRISYTRPRGHRTKDDPPAAAKGAGHFGKSLVAEAASSDSSSRDFVRVATAENSIVLTDGPLPS
jgi:hypothetical protein